MKRKYFVLGVILLMIASVFSACTIGDAINTGGGKAPLEIRSVPSGAKVYIDNVYSGVTPVNKYVEGGKSNAPVKHTITVSKGKSGNTPSYETQEKEVALVAGNTKTVVAFTLMTTERKLKVDSNPEKASVFVDGRYTGVAGSSFRLKAGEAEEGDHAVMLRATGKYATYYQETNFQVHLDSENATARDEIPTSYEKKDLYTQSGDLYITATDGTKPGKFKVFVNGAYRGMTPVTVTRVPVACDNSVEIQDIDPKRKLAPYTVADIVVLSGTTPQTTRLNVDMLNAVDSESKPECPPEPLPTPEAS